MSSETSYNGFTHAECVSIVSGLVAASINFLAVDFDLTLVDEHTGGRYDGSATTLSTRVRPFFLTLIPLAIESGAALLRAFYNHIVI